MMNGDSATGGAPQNVEIIIATGDLSLFKSFLAHKRAFEVMLQSGVFDLADGKATINFHSGHVQTVLVEERRYQHVVLPKGFG